MPAPQLFVITGIMAAGKSTVAQALAERFPRSVHVRGDSFRRAVVRGYHEMTPDPSEAAVRDLRLRYEIAAMVADCYVDAGFVTVVQDVVIGEELPRFLAMLRTRPLGLVVLAPSAEAVVEREAGRQKTGYRDFTPAELDRDLRTTTPRIGLWLDPSALTVAETVDAILADLTATLVH
jgi:predicted kinase